MDNQLPQTTVDPNSTSQSLVTHDNFPKHRISKSWVILIGCYLLLMGFCYYVFFIYGKSTTNDIPQCALNKKFPPVNPHSLKPASEDMKITDPKSPISPYVGAYEGILDGNLIRLVIFPTSQVHLMDNSKSIEQKKTAFRNAIIKANQLTWTFEKQTFKATLTQNKAAPLLITVKKKNQSTIASFKSCSIQL